MPITKGITGRMVSPIVGPIIGAAWPASPSGGDNLLLESGDDLLLESGSPDVLLLE